MINYIGPLNSGVAVGSNGSATANSTSAQVISGRVLGVYVRYNDSPPAGTTDVTIATAGNTAPAVSVLTITDAATSGWFYPRVALMSTVGAAVTYDGTRPIYGELAIHDNVKVTIAQANAADNVDVWLMVEN